MFVVLLLMRLSLVNFGAIPPSAPEPPPPPPDTTTTTTTAFPSTTLRLRTPVIPATTVPPPEEIVEIIEEPNVEVVEEPLVEVVEEPIEQVDPPKQEDPVLWNSDVVNGHCVGFEFLLSQYSPGWSVSRMSGIMYRESRCSPDARNSCCSGLLQIHRIHLPIHQCGIFTREDLYDPAKNICSAARIWNSSGYGAWTTA